MKRGLEIIGGFMALKSCKVLNKGLERLGIRLMMIQICTVVKTMILGTPKNHVNVHS